MATRVVRSAAVAVSVAALLLSAGCGGGGSDEEQAAPSGDGSAAAAPSEGASSSSGGSDFVDPTTATAAKWMPLKPGTQILRTGTTMIGKRKVPHKVVVTVTDVVREINGIKTVLVLDEAHGADQIVEKSVDYFAQDGDGNVWMMGSTTEQYENGKLVGIDEAWLDGKKKGKGGIIVPADPTSGQKWDLPLPPGEKADSAEFVEMKSEVCVPFDCYKDVLVVLEGKPDAVESELKYYAAGVGQIKNEPKKSPEQDFQELENVTQLSGDGLAEASKEALRIDESAAEEEPDLYGDVKAARIS